MLVKEAHEIEESLVKDLFTLVQRSCVVLQYYSLCQASRQSMRQAMKEKRYIFVILICVIP